MEQAEASIPFFPAKYPDPSKGKRTADKQVDREREKRERKR
jgi:hypothetical protein